MKWTLVIGHAGNRAVLNGPSPPLDREEEDEQKTEKTEKTEKDKKKAAKRPFNRRRRRGSISSEEEEEDMESSELSIASEGLPTNNEDLFIFWITVYSMISF